jgi:hypothetical protein
MQEPVQAVDFHLQAAGGGAGVAQPGLADVRRDGLQGGEEGAVGGFGVEDVVGDFVQPVPCLPGFAEGEVVQVQAVGRGAVAGAGGELPPELGALRVVGEVEQAGEDEGAVDVQVTVVGGRFGFLGEAVDVVGGVGSVENPAAYDGQPLSGLGGEDGVRVGMRASARRSSMAVTVLSPSCSWAWPAGPGGCEGVLCPCGRGSRRCGCPGPCSGRSVWWGSRAGGAGRFSLRHSAVSARWTQVMASPWTEAH